MSTTDRSTWNRAKPYSLPRPTYWPAALALGNALLLWGILTTWILSVIGAGLCAVSVAGWVREWLRTPGEGGDDGRSTTVSERAQHLPR